MNNRYTVISAAIFGTVALIHLIRASMGWTVSISAWSFPVWASWITVVVAGSLSVFGFRSLKSSTRPLTTPPVE
ncbi:MAG: hypothetical protein CMH81_06115 [Nitrospiraceae bacterium]|jgi:hypothetical protein|nr:hypothetical protein [Nitrospiraceae bacterium]